MARFQSFVRRRNHLQFLEKWDAALAEYQPRSPRSRELVETAIARAEAFAERCRTAGRSAIDPPRKQGRFDPATQELRHRELNDAVQKAYVAHLTEALDEAEQERNFWRKSAKGKRFWMAGKRSVRKLFVRS